MISTLSIAFPLEYKLFNDYTLIWTLQTTPIQPNSITKYHFLHDGSPLTFQDFIDHLTTNPSFRSWYNTILADCDFPAFFWEHPPLSEATLRQPYEFVLIRSQTLAHVTSQPEAFAEFFQTKDKVVDFRNLSGDAHLIAPTPQGDHSYYTHLANFVRLAPADQQQAFWKRVGERYCEAIQTGKRWLSTSGLGVYWLHARIDSYPKYYQYNTYRL